MEGAQSITKTLILDQRFALGLCPFSRKYKNYSCVFVAGHHKIRLWCCNMSMASNCSTVCWGKGVKNMNRVNRSLHIVSIKASRKGCCDKPSHDDTVLNILLLPFGSPFYVFKPTIDLASQMNYTHSKCAIRRSIHTIHIQTIFL
ncbi:hypothetical protein LXL04_028878 [Taraxacum kok-saghyz]